jgi:6-oxo-cyclohex-1-ene-carbonyl-CoA hydrolase
MAAPETRFLRSHDLAEVVTQGVRFERRPARTPDGKTVGGLYNAWIWLDNAGQYN